MRSIRLASLAIATAVMSACSNDVTAPIQRAPEAPSPSISCSGFLLSSGRCEGAQQPVAPTGTVRGPKPITVEPLTMECSGFLLSTGRCE